MSTEERLPADLSALEARLAALRPSEAKLDRDAVLYEAGYQAGLRAKALSAAVAPSVSAGMNCSDATISNASIPNAAIRKTSIPALTLRARFASRIALASLASAALAASVAVLVTRASLIPAPTSQENAQVASVSEESSDVAVRAPIEEEQSEAEELETALKDYPRADSWGSGAGDYKAGGYKYDAWGYERRNSMLSLRAAILRGEEIPSGWNTSFVSAEYAPPKTARQLRAELLPQREAVAPTSNWQWLKHFRSQGETI